jgi:hypothetical protein
VWWARAHNEKEGLAFVIGGEKGGSLLLLLVYVIIRKPLVWGVVKFANMGCVIIHLFEVLRHSLDVGPDRGAELVTTISVRHESCSYYAS